MPCSAWNRSKRCPTPPMARGMLPSLRPRRQPRRHPADLDLLAEAVRPAPRPVDVDVVIGVRGPVAPPEACNGLMVPVVVFDQLYSFDVDTLIGSIPRPEQIAAEQFGPASEELF